MNTIPRGIYQHYKGQQYEVLGCAHHSETEELLVVYRALYGDYGLWVRPFTIFSGSVVVKKPLRDTYSMRFAKPRLLLARRSI